MSSLVFAPIDDYLANVRQIVRKAPSITVRRAYMRALREWCQQTQWLRVALPGFTTADTKIYTLGTDEALDVVGIRAASVTETVGGRSQTSGLLPSDSTQWNADVQNALPRRYCYVPESKFALDPTPNATYDLLITLVVVPRESATQVPVDPLVKYSNNIEAGALAYLLSIPDQPWTDPAAALRYAREFAVGIANGKAEVQRSFNTGSMRVRSRPFLAGGW